MFCLSFALSHSLTLTCPSLCRMCEPSPPALRPYASDVTMVGVSIKQEEEESGGGGGATDEGREPHRSSPVENWSSPPPPVDSRTDDKTTPLSRPPTSVGVYLFDWDDRSQNVSAVRCDLVRDLVSVYLKSQQCTCLKILCSEHTRQDCSILAVLKK